MKSNFILLSSLSILSSICLNSQGEAAQKKEASPNTTLIVSAALDNKKANYKIGETISFNISMHENKRPVKGKFIVYTIFHNGLPFEKKTVSGDNPFTVTTSLDCPGWVSIQGIALDENKKPIKRIHSLLNRNKNGGIGVLVEPEKIYSLAKEPADFDEFWAKQIKELKQCPLKSDRRKLEVPKKFKNKIDLYNMKINCVGNMPVSGYLAMPSRAKKASLPAIVSFHGAGVRSAKPPYKFADKAICLEINAHGIENGKPGTFYKKLAKTTLSAYWHKNKKDHQKNYFKGMYQRVLRSLEYVKSLPEWDGKRLIVMGASQGGAQSIVAAALDPDVTLCVANVPALCDHPGDLLSRKAGWPQFYKCKNGKLSNPETAHELEYYDTIHFASRINCETYFATGLIDFICPPCSVISAFNKMPSKTKKDIEVQPSAGHNALSIAGEKRIREIVALRK